MGNGGCLPWEMILHGGALLQMERVRSVVNVVPAAGMRTAERESVDRQLSWAHRTIGHFGARMSRRRRGDVAGFETGQARNVGYCTSARPHQVISQLYLWEETRVMFVLMAELGHLGAGKVRLNAGANAGCACRSNGRMGTITKRVAGGGTNTNHSVICSYTDAPTAGWVPPPNISYYPRRTRDAATAACTELQ